MKLAAAALIFAALISLAAASALPPSPQFVRSRSKESSQPHPGACSYVASGAGDETQPMAVNLKRLLDKYNALLDFDDMEEFIQRKLDEGDPDSLKIIAHLYGANANTVVDFLWDDPAFTNLIRWAYDNGLTNIYNEFSKLHAIFGWKPIGLQNEIEVMKIHEPETRRRHQRSIGDLVDEFTELVPIDQMINLTLELLAMRDETLIALIVRMSCPDLAALWFRLKSLPEVQESIEVLREEGVQIDHFMTLLETLFGWRSVVSKTEARTNHRHEHKHDLGTAWKQILAVVDKEGLKEFWKEFQRLPCGQEALEYVRGKDFDQLITDFYDEKQFINIMDWIQKNGLDHLFEYIATVHSELGLEEPPYPRKSKCSPEDWAEIRAKLNTQIPQDKLNDTIYELIKRDDSVQKLLELLASDQVDRAYHHFTAKPSYQTFAQKLRNAGFKIDEFITIVEALMGWDNRPRHKLV